MAEEMQKDSEKREQECALTHRSAMVSKAIQWLKDNQPPRKSSAEAADAVYSIQETFDKWPNGYKRPPKGMKNEDSFVRTITNRRNALPKPF